ncbi:hypothetical protein SAMN02745126_03704 [Enhydrobacter aerosaccus]|uniref:Uncharacterized protein n=1 Tax=Enhydrobacter aerosaccus TaxID=225324 RepID=A0A1T4RA00_9HYPH|nr:hypothetical protein [Enhydrobacter aerosaccus]SKA12636.1 hypothetical protein SAMN02745126_03704 [Enhydrobacter aerosaccus]
MPDGLYLDKASGQTASTVLECSSAYSLPLRSTHRIWRWTLRLALPALVCATGVILYWIWFDSAYGLTGWPAIVMGLPLVFEAAAVTLWTVTTWSSNDAV